MPLDPHIAEELRSAERKLDAEGKLLSRAQISDYYAGFRARYGLDQLKALDGEDLLLAMHGRGDQSSLMYWLEFKNDDEFQTRSFGSIAGGSSFKYGIYYSQEKATWLAGHGKSPTEVTLADAILFARKQRDELVAAAEVLSSLPQGASDEQYRQLQSSLDQVAPTIIAGAWVHKYLGLLFPEKLDDIHSTDHQRFHLIRLLQTPPPGDGRYLAAGRFLSLAAELGLHPNQFTLLLNERNGRTPYAYWRIGTREGDAGPSRWDEMKHGGYVAIGWDAMGDLTPLKAMVEGWERRDKIREILLATHPSVYAGKPEGVATTHAVQIGQFLASIDEGDVVIAADGATVRGIGRVAGAYEFSSAGPFRHRMPVTWLSLDEWKVPEAQHLRGTVKSLAKYPAILIQAERGILGAGPVVVPPMPGHTDTLIALPMLSGVAARVEGILRRKGQVILYGPCGTGKTYWADRSARELAARSWFGKSLEQLTSAEYEAIVGTDSQPGRAVMMCCFHPAYGYEDFLEGFRPRCVDGRMLFEPRDGIFKRLCQDAAAQPDRDFFLLIDEINRGDVPRIFGELLTVIEKDKRGKAILLPLTGTTFRVPVNVFLIGTMNTADRSIALLDAALRRRFGFIEMMPDASLLGQTVIGGLPVRRWLESLNKDVCQHAGRDARNLQVGHSYFLTNGGQPISDIATLVQVMREDVIPLIEEHCYEDYAALSRILGKQVVDVTRQCVREELFQPGQGDLLVQALIAHHPELAVAVPELQLDEVAEDGLEEPGGQPIGADVAGEGDADG